MNQSQDNSQRRQSKYQNEPEKVVLVGALFQNEDLWELEEGLAELANLAGAAGAKTVGQVVQKLTKPNAATYIGPGKVKELKELCEAEEVSTLIFHDDLSPTQLRNLEAATEVKVIDRSELVLDIFARHAQSRDGKLQVELAQLEYLLPRLTGKGTYLSRQGGGIGTTGPGETQLELDRRKLQNRVHNLKEELEKVSRHRNEQRKQRHRNPLPWLVLMGYTNAGKSSLLNQLTGSDILAKDEPFSTLDTTTRRFKLPSGQELLFSDTVGFIKNLPRGLIAAFRATLEEVHDANALLHVVDISNPLMEDQIKAVESTLADLGLGDKPIIYVFNKIDKLEPGDNAFTLAAQYNPGIMVSANSGEGVDQLAEAVQNFLNENQYQVELFFPYNEQARLEQLYRQGEILEREDGNDGVRVVARVNLNLAERLAKFTTS